MRKILTNISISRWCKSSFFFENRIKIIWIGKTGSVCNLCNSHSTFDQKFLSFYNTNLPNIIVNIKTSNRFKNSREIICGVCPTWGWEYVYEPSRAYENGVYVAAAMSVPYGEDIHGLRSPSQIIGPDGKILNSGSVSEAGIVMGDVEIRDCKEFRRLRMSDRKPETYNILCQ